MNLNTELAKARDDEESAIDGIRRELSRVIGSRGGDFTMFRVDD